MGAKAMLPLIDCILLTLGTVLAAMTQMQRVQALPVSVAKVGPGAAVVHNGRFAVLALTADGLHLDGRAVTADQAAAELTGGRVVLRADASLPTERTLQVVAALSKAGADVSVEVAPAVDATGSTPGGEGV